jgi:hypothetical protein
MAEAEARARIDLVLMTRALTIPLWGRDLEAAAHSYAFEKTRGQLQNMQN